MLYAFFFSLAIHITHCLASSLFFHPHTSALRPADLVLNLNLSLAPLLSPGSFTYFSSSSCFFTAAHRSRVFLLCTSSVHLCSHFLFPAFVSGMHLSTFFISFHHGKFSAILTSYIFFVNLVSSILLNLPRYLIIWSFLSVIFLHHCA